MTGSSLSGRRSCGVRNTGSLEMTEAVDPPWWSVPDVVESRDDGEDEELRKTEGRKQTDKGSAGAGGRCSYFTLAEREKKARDRDDALKVCSALGYRPEQLEILRRQGSASEILSTEACRSCATHNRSACWSISPLYPSLTWHRSRERP